MMNQDDTNLKQPSNHSEPAMRYYPIFVDMESRAVLVFGNNESALQKTRLLLKTPAKVFIFHSLSGKQEHCLMSVLKNEYTDNTLTRLHVLTINSIQSFKPLDFRMVYQCNDDENYSVEESTFMADWLNQCRDAGVLINSVDMPDECDFLTPSIVDRAPLTIAIGTEGVAPTLGQKVKTQLETWLPNNLSRYLQHAKSLRPRVLQHLPLSHDRRIFWRAFFADSLRELFFRDKTVFNKAIDDLITTSSGVVNNTTQHEHANDDSKGHIIGHISFVGAGPGDPELLTLKAIQKLQNADVIIYDRLVNQDILEYARRDAIRINVGKKPGSHGATQHEINALLVEQANIHKAIVRLKGGDPLIFGRISEEIETLNQQKIGYDIVPGITSAIGCAANTNIALTNRESHHGLIILSGHSQFGMPDYDWQSLANLKLPIVFYMGVKNAPAISDKLIEAGIDLSASVTIIENGLRDNEKVIVSNVKHYINAMNTHEIKGPALIYIGLNPVENTANTSQSNRIHFPVRAEPI